jgi:hypothetical protein
MAECGLRTVIPFDDDTVRIANDSAYGLARGLETKSLAWPAR